MKRWFLLVLILLLSTTAAPSGEKPAAWKPITISWHGQSFFILQSSQGTRVAFDPHLLPEYGRPMGLKADLILIDTRSINLMPMNNPRGGVVMSAHPGNVDSVWFAGKRVKGFSLGVGAVLFVALAIGWLAPKSAPAPMVGTLGLALFLYAAGVQYGKQFFLGLKSAAGRRANLIALTGVLASGVVSILFVKTMGLNVGHALGLFAGSGTSTPTLQAAIATLEEQARSMSYGDASPGTSADDVRDLES